MEGNPYYNLEVEEAVINGQETGTCPLFLRIQMIPDSIAKIAQNAEN